jgi:BspA type Leucine rich repeat region (6 copies)
MKTKPSISRAACPKLTARRSRTACPTRLLLLLLLLTLPAVVQAQFTYTTNDGTLNITKYTGSNSVVTIPDTITGLPVTSIGFEAFGGCTSLTSITIPNSVTSIGSWAFENCSSLTSVTIPSSVTSIGGSAFANCDLTNVIIPNSVTNIGGGAFSYCYYLTAITVDAVNPSYSSADGVLFNKSQTTLVQFPGGIAGSYTIPNSVTCIGDWAFATYSGLTNIMIGNGVTNIGGHAFSDNSVLTSVRIPDSVTGIGDSAFWACWSLTNATIGNGVTNIGDEAFFDCLSLASVTIPNSVTCIGDLAFGNCKSLTSITIPTSVTSIGGEAFVGCGRLTGVYFNGNAPSIGSDGFIGGDHATVYYLPGTTGWSEFSANTGLPVVLWNPQVQTSGASFGVRTNRFGFNITGTSNLVIVVEACTNLANHTWSPVATNTLTGGSSYFSDPQWTNYPARFYRLRSP